MNLTFNKCKILEFNPDESRQLIKQLVEMSKEFKSNRIKHMLIGFKDGHIMGMSNRSLWLPATEESEFSGTLYVYKPLTGIEWRNGFSEIIFNIQTYNFITADFVNIEDSYTISVFKYPNNEYSIELYHQNCKYTINTNVAPSCELKLYTISDPIEKSYVYVDNFGNLEIKEATCEYKFTVEEFMEIFDKSSPANNMFGMLLNLCVVPKQVTLAANKKNMLEIRSYIIGNNCLFRYTTIKMYSSNPDKPIYISVNINAI